MIEIRSLYCGYGKGEVLKDLNLRIQRGEMVGILGPNGSGKSTLILSISGILPYRSGSIRVAGEEIAGTSTRWMAQHMASVPQRAELTFPFRCLTVVLMGRYPFLSRWGGYSQEDRQTALEAMEQTETLHLAQRMITEVSGGEAQRVMIARALAQQADILLLDEATSNLDVAKKVQIFDLFRKKNRLGATLLCVMHDLNLASLYCERLVFLRDGGIVLDGPTEETFHDRTLSEIYGTEIRVSRHPTTGRPQAHFVPGPDGGPDDPVHRPHAMEGTLGPGCGDYR